MGSTPPSAMPPASTPEAPALQIGNGEHPPQPQADGLEAMRDALVKERRLRKAAEIKLARLRQQHISDVEKAVQVARDEDRAEAFRAAGLRVAAAEFRAVAVGKLADPAAALEVLDLSRFVGDGGGVDLASLTAMVNKLAAAVCTAGPTGRVCWHPLRRSALGAYSCPIRAQASRSAVHYASSGHGRAVHYETKVPLPESRNPVPYGPNRLDACALKQDGASQVGPVWEQYGEPHGRFVEAAIVV